MSYKKVAQKIITNFREITYKLSKNIMIEIFSTYFQFLKGHKSICYYLRANVREKVNISIDDALIAIQSKCNFQ